MRRFRFELAAHPGSPAQARRLTRARLTAWSVCEDTCDTADLVVSELVTNAIVHTASSRIVCELHDGGDLVRIAVQDEGCAPGEPHPSPQRAEEEHGRGLLLVEAVCRAWGARQHGPGLVVWAELARATAGAAQDARAEWDAPGPPGTYEAWGDLGWGARPKPDPVPQPRPDGEGTRRGPRTGGATHWSLGSQATDAHEACGPHDAHRAQGTQRPHETHGTGAAWL